MNENWSMTVVERTLIGFCSDWIQRKIVASDGFSVLLASAHPDGNRMSIYTLDSVESALAKCEEDLKGELSSATAYALVFDAFIERDGKPQPLLVFQCEVKGSGIAMRLGQLYWLTKSFLSEKKKLELEGSLQLMGPREPWLV